MDLQVAEIKAFFSAPNPKNPTGETLTKETEPTLQANFHWVAFQVLFSDESQKEPPYYIYSVDLTTDGKESLPNKVFESDSAWDATNKDVPAPNLTPGDARRNLKTKAGDLLLKGSDLITNLMSDIKSRRIDNHDMAFINTDKTDKGGVYSVERFEKMFDNEFYVVLSKEKQKKNPWGTLVGVSKDAMINKMAVKLAMEGVQTGGKDIMRRLVQKQKAEQGLPAPLSGETGTFTGGFGEMRKWQEGKQGKPQKDLAPEGEGYDVMKQVKKNPVPVKKDANI